MNPQRDAWKAGIMVLVCTAAGVGFFFYLAGPAYFRATLEAETYISGSVTGLSVGSDVSLRGVPVGRVTDLTFPGAQYGGPSEVFENKFGDYVMVVFEIDAESNSQTTEDLRRVYEGAVREGLRARTKMASITGGSVLDLGKPGAEVPAAFQPTAWTPQRLYIPAAPGILDEMLADIQRVLGNLAAFDLNGIGIKLNEILADAESLINNDGKELLESLKQNSAALQVVLKDPEIQRTLRELADAAGGIHHLVKANSPAVRELLQSLNETITNLEALSAQLRQDPSAIIFTAPPPKLPPSEPRSSRSPNG
ncbi:MAG: MlaD family protein [Planctomycetota bacterium]|nr:MlaD family protein [Planctomycetota bacterium]MDA1106564.1 MlaD family protein [Planctomycetota bacterium]